MDWSEFRLAKSRILLTWTALRSCESNLRFQGCELNLNSPIPISKQLIILIEVSSTTNRVTTSVSVSSLLNWAFEKSVSL